MTVTLDVPDARARVSRLLDAHTDSTGRLNLDPGTLERDLARLVLAVMEMLRELMELQAIRRLEAGSLTARQEEDLGDALFRSREKLREVARSFGLCEQDLTLDLALDAQNL